MQFNSTSLPDQVRDLHPNLKFCGEPKNAILSVSDDLLSYVLSILKNDPILPPRISIIKWLELLHILKAHWVLPLLYWHTGKLPDEFRPPEPVFDNMRTAFQWSRARCFHMERQLQEIVPAFNDEGVRMVVLKGPALGRTVYPDPALRPSSDLDLLVRPEQFIRAREILKGVGYKCEFKLFEVFKDFHCEEVFIKLTNSRVARPVEIHWDLQPFFGKKRGNGVKELFQKTIAADTVDMTFETLHPVDTLIHAASHLTMVHNQDMRLIWIYDIALLAQNLEAPGDWEMLQDRSSDWGARQAVETALKLAQIVTGLELPGRFSNFSTWPKPEEADVTAMAYALNRHRRPDIRFKLRLSACSNSQQKARFLFRFIVPHPDVIKSSTYYSTDSPLSFAYFRRWRSWIVEIMRYVFNINPG